MAGPHRQPAIRGRSGDVPGGARRRCRRRGGIGDGQGERRRAGGSSAIGWTVSGGSAVRSSTHRQSWVIALPVLLLLLWTVVYPERRGDRRELRERARALAGVRRQPGRPRGAVDESRDLGRVGTGVAGDRRSPRVPPRPVRVSAAAGCCAPSRRCRRRCRRSSA